MGMAAAKSQTNAVRIEFDAELDADIYHVAPCKDKGVLVFFESQEIVDAANRLWYFSLHDALLEQSWLKKEPVLMGVEYHDYCISGNKYIIHFPGR